MTPVVKFHANRAQLERALLEALQERLTQSAAANHEPDSADAPFAVMLSGGSTPIPAYRELALSGRRARPGLHILFSDERYVPAVSEASNYFQARALLDSLQLDKRHLLRVRTELPLADAAAQYAQELAGLAARRIPLGFALLGLGADGHTCSLFSKADLESGRGTDAIAVARPDGRQAVTVTPRVLERAERIVFAVAGADKQTAVRMLLERDAAQVAWCAVSRCREVEIWGDSDALASG